MAKSRSGIRVMWVQAEPEGPNAAQLIAALSGSDAFGGPYRVERRHDLDSCARLPQPGGAADAMVLSLSSTDAEGLSAWPALPSLCADSAVLVLTPVIDAASALRLLNAGVQDVVLQRDAASLPQRLCLASERKRLQQELLKAHATDLKTGLPNRQQLIEHMSQLLALRERESRPVSLLVMRIDGLDGVESGHGHEAANVVRRKVAVRLRAGVRASDVVASLGANVFAVLLSVMESPADTQHVIDKLVRAVREPFNVAGTQVGLSACAGAAHFPQDGRQPETLLQHASGLALLGARSLHEAAND
jgi:diguanylate cyclase (GGDEF)-like protein